MGPARGDEILVVDPEGRDDERDGDFAEPVVGHSHHRGVGHPVDEAQDLLDVLGKHLVAAPVDDVARPALDPHEPVGVDPGEVTGVDIPLGIHPLRRDPDGGRRRPNQKCS